MSFNVQDTGTVFDFASYDEIQETWIGDIVCALENEQKKLAYKAKKKKEVELLWAGIEPGSKRFVQESQQAANAILLQFDCNKADIPRCIRQRVLERFEKGDCSILVDLKHAASGSDTMSEGSASAVEPKSKTNPAVAVNSSAAPDKPDETCDENKPSEYVRAGQEATGSEDEKKARQHDSGIPEEQKESNQEQFTSMDGTDNVIEANRGVRLAVDDSSDDSTNLLQSAAKAMEKYKSPDAAKVTQQFVLPNDDDNTETKTDPASPIQQS